MDFNFLHLRSLKTRVTLFTLVIFLTGIWALAFYTIHMLQVDMEHSLGEQQFSTVSLLSAQVNQELEERFKSLKIIAGQFSQANLDNPSALKELLEQRPIFLNLFNSGVLVYQPDGTAIAEAPPSTGRIGVNYMDRDHVALALKEGKASVGRPVFGRKLQTPVFGMTVPISDAQGKVIGALTGVTDLGKLNFLDKITENRYGKTGGYVLLIPKYRLIVTATDKSRIMQSLPALGVNPMLDRFLQGYEGSAVYTNPLGVEVLGSAKQLPVSDWLMGVTLPTEEAFAPIREMQQRMLLTTIFLTMLMWFLSWWMLKRQLSPMIAASRKLATLSDINQPPQPLPITSQDEIGHLIGGFNRLLETLAKRESALQESEMRFRTMANAMPQLAWIARSDGHVYWYNQRWYDYTGTVPDQMEGPGWQSVHDPNVLPKVLEGWQASLSTGEPFDMTFPLRGADGVFRPFLTRIIPLKDNAGRVMQWFGTNTDISELKRVEKSLRESEALYRSIGESIDYGVWICEPDGRSTYASESFLQMVGITQEQYSNFGWSELLHPEDAERTIAAWRECVRTGCKLDREQRFRDTHGQWQYVLTRGVPVRNEQGEIINWTGINLDINRIKQAEERIRASLTEKEVLLKEVHHRVKNNLQIISSLISLQADSLIDDKLQGVLGDVRNRVRTMALVHEKLYQTEDLSRLDFAEYARSLLKYLWSAYGAGTGKVRLNMSLEPMFLSVEMAVPCGLILNELTSNAIKHAFPNCGGEVMVTMKHDPSTGAVCLRVRDNGVGLPADLDWRQSSSLGLRLVQMLVGQMRGTVKTGTCSGTEFQIHFNVKGISS